MSFIPQQISNMPNVVWYWSKFPIPITRLPSKQLIFDFLDANFKLQALISTSKQCVMGI